MNLYRWTQISDIPYQPGIYAWYYSPEITNYDLQLAIRTIEDFKQNNDKQSATDAVKAFLEKHIFQYFQEEPYQASLNGLLKPKYEGHLEHKPSISGELIDRIIKDPQRLETIKNVVESSAPYFASPIYIGMSDKLGQRIKEHKKLIEKYRTEPNSKQRIRAKDSDHCFAMEVCRRNLLPDRLFIIIQIIDNDGKRYIDLENILNRIHYPLLGRN